MANATTTNAATTTGALVSALEHEMSKRSHVSSLKSADLTVDKEREAVRALGEARTAEGKTWNSDVQYVLAAIGSAIGLGNFLRFPSLAYRYGGAAFLIPYVLAIVLVGIPIMGLECTFGQMMQNSAVPAFGKIRPYLWGLGAFLTAASAVTALSYNTIMAWTLVYLVYSFSPGGLPWGSTVEESTAFYYTNILGKQDAETGEMWTLQQGLGPVQWKLALAMLVYWSIVYACIVNGTKTVQKVVLVTVPLPIILILVFLFYGAAQEGAGTGIQAYVDPSENHVELNSINPWVDAVGQIFFGLSLCEGVMLAYASRQPLHKKVVRNSWLIVIGNCGCSLVAGFAVFALLGHFATVQGVGINDIGIGSTFVVAFQTFPAAFNLFQGAGVPQIMAVLFFITLLCLGIDSSMAFIEAVSLAFIDSNRWCKENPRKVSGGLCMTGFLLTLIMSTRAGYDVLDILDHYTNNYMLLLGGAVSTIVLGWFYDAKKLVKEVRENTGENASYLPFLWEYMIKFITPTILCVLTMYRFAEDLMVPHGNGEYPGWALFIFGWAPCLVIPALAFGGGSLAFHFIPALRKKVKVDEDIEA